MRTIRKNFFVRKTFKNYFSLLKKKLKRLNNIVWTINFVKSDREIVVIDAALLLEAGWGKYLNQVWCTFVPKNEAIERIVARDNVSKENVKQFFLDYFKTLDTLPL